MATIGIVFFAQAAYAQYPTLSDFWGGAAEWHFVRAYTTEQMSQGHTTNLGPGFTGGSGVTVVGKAWYLFFRRIEIGMPVPEYCANYHQPLLSVVVSRSIDEGLTWSTPIRIVTASPGTAWECGATDGGAFYNKQEHKWYYLFQCLNRHAWQGCYATRKGDDPMGAFETPETNVVIPAGSLWARICNEKNYSCFRLSGGYGKIHDEGTFDIFDYRDGYYFVDFHGYDGVRGYRGVVKTRDFRSWEIVAPDAILDRDDALSFAARWDANGPIGFGAGRILKDNGYYYLISEAADKNLACTKGQQWVWGMFRAKDLAAGRSWESYTRNPFFSVTKFPSRDPNPEPCNPAYAGLFKSQSGKTYFFASRPSRNPKFDGIYLYELVFSHPTRTDPKARGIRTHKGEEGQMPRRHSVK